MTEIINQQRKIKIETKVFHEFAQAAIEQIADGKHATIAFVSDKKMKELNRDFRGKNTTTDVLSFPYERDEFEADDHFLGDIVISIEQAARQAEENHLSLDLEVRQLILHGVLHLLGYDHETDQGEMNELELEWRRRLGID
jgi:probable rRNA maturation factor